MARMVDMAAFSWMHVCGKASGLSDERQYYSAVVPAKAGTHTPCVIVLALEQRPSAISEARGYGSRPSPGRRVEELFALNSHRRRRHPAVDHDGLAGHEARRIRSQVRHGAGDLVRL